MNVFICTKKDCANFDVKYNMLSAQEAECGGCGIILIGQPDSLPELSPETIESN